MEDKTELRQKLLDDCDVEYICETVGVEMRHRGNATEVLCPFHNDRHYGNARIRGKGIYCFACAKQYSVFDIVMKNLGMQFFEAYRYVAEHTGDITDYIPKRKKRMKPADQFPLNKNELEFIGFADGSAKCVLYVTDERPSGKEKYDCILDEDGSWLYEVYETVHFTMRDVWESSHEDCLELLGDKTCEKAGIIHQKLLQAKLSDPDLVDIYEELQNYVISIYQKLIRKGYRKRKLARSA